MQTWVPLNLNRHFSKENTQMAKKNMKRRSTWLIVQKFKSNPQWYHFTFIRMVIIEKHNITHVGKDVKKLKSLCIADAKVKWYVENNMAIPQTITITILQFYFWAYNQKNFKWGTQRDICTSTFIACLIAKRWNQLKCPSTDECINKM